MISKLCQHILQSNGNAGINRAMILSGESQDASPTKILWNELMRAIQSPQLFLMSSAKSQFVFGKQRTERRKDRARLFPVTGFAFVSVEMRFHIMLLWERWIALKSVNTIYLTLMVMKIDLLTDVLRPLINSALFDCLLHFIFVGNGKWGVHAPACQPAHWHNLQWWVERAEWGAGFQCRDGLGEIQHPGAKTSATPGLSLEACSTFNISFGLILSPFFLVSLVWVFFW